jgi:hypothetical protein
MPKETPFVKKTEKYIETGSHQGYSIQLALDSGFSDIYSIELIKDYYDFCVKRFEHLSNVRLFLGDSPNELYKILKSMPDTSFTYWLDAHSNTYTPILKELEIILSRQVNGELIYIDDMRLYNQFSDEVNIVNIENLIKKLKPTAKLSYESDSLHEKDILVIEY